MSDREPMPQAPSELLETIRAQSVALADIARRVDDDIAYLLDVVVKTIDLRNRLGPKATEESKDRR
jgi:hypothetical protein